MLLSWINIPLNMMTKTVTEQSDDNIYKQLPKTFCKYIKCVLQAEILLVSH